MTPTLKDDRLPNITAISEYLCGQATPSTIRRIRHLIAAHGFPHKKVGGKIESRKSWIDAYYAEPDKPSSESAAYIANGAG
jgi:hypothetical protein